MFFPLMSMGAVNSVMFGVYGNQLRLLQGTCETPREKERLLLQHVFLAGTAAGFVQSFLACPAELIKIKLQTHKCEWFGGVNLNPSLHIQYFENRIRFTDYRPAEARTIRSYVRYLIKRHGFTCMFRGLPLTIARYVALHAPHALHRAQCVISAIFTPCPRRDVLPYGIYMHTYVSLMLMLKQFMVMTELNLDYTKDIRGHEANIRRDRDSLALTVIAGSLAGIFSWTVVIPFDVMKTKMQADDSYKSSWHCVRHNYNKYGWRSLFRGGWVVLARAVPINAATFVGFEWASNKCMYVFDV